MPNNTEYSLILMMINKNHLSETFFIDNADNINRCIEEVKALNGLEFSMFAKNKVGEWSIAYPILYGTLDEFNNVLQDVASGKNNAPKDTNFLDLLHAKGNINNMYRITILQLINTLGYPMYEKFVLPFLILMQNRDPEFERYRNFFLTMSEELNQAGLTEKNERILFKIYRTLAHYLLIVDLNKNITGELSLISPVNVKMPRCNKALVVVIGDIVPTLYLSSIYDKPYKDSNNRPLENYIKYRIIVNNLNYHIDKEKADELYKFQ